MAAKARKVFINLPVKDLDATMAFFEGLGFEFNPHFQDENAACMIFSEDAYAMLLVEKYFATFTDNRIADTSTHTEVLVCFSCESREEVDEIRAKAIAGGGKPAKEAKDYGFMYGWSFYDINGHHWELMWMDPAAIPGQGEG